MKKLFYLLLLIAGFVNGQIVNIPDANFKAKLLAANNSNQIAYGNGAYIIIDSNDDGEIQELEAQAVDSLNVQFSSIINMTGIISFSNIKKLSCYNNGITNLNLSNLTQLKIVNCRYNQIASFNLIGLVSLENLNCFSNQLTNVDLSTVNNLKYLNCASNNLTELNIANLIQLENLYLSGNNLPNLDVSNSINLKELVCTESSLTTLNVSNLINLETLSCNYNSLTSLDVSDLTNLKTLSCSGNSLTNLDISNLVNLQTLYCSQNLLTTLNCNYNTALTALSIYGNQNLQLLFLHNGSDESINIDSGNWLENWFNCPNLHYICTDENEVVPLQNIVNGPGFPNSNIIVNSYCSFNPGGDYNTITGALRYDGNNDGCDGNDPFIPNIKIKMQQWGLDSYTFSNNSGNYKFYTTFADQSVEPIFENPTYFNPSPAAAVISFPDTNLTAIQDFCITTNGVHPDLEIVLAPVTPARPGFDAVYILVLKNKGNQSLSSWTGCLLNYDATKMNFVSASSTITNATAGQLETGFSLNPFETQVVQFIFHINAPTDAVPVNIGDLLTFNATITSSTTDDTPLDNAFNYLQTVVGSYDPNDIACLQGETVSPSEIGNYLHYMVNFENTGNYAAENVVVKIEIDTNKFDVASLQLLDSSNPVDARVTGNKVEFIFKNIQLAGPGGHGNILLKIKSKNNLVTGDMVSKIANIYFDYNAPVTTLPFDTTFQTLGLNNPNLDDSIAVFPNPTSNFVMVKSKNEIKSIQLFDVQGRLLQTNFNNQKETKIDISAKGNGVYFLKITSELGVKIERIVKQ